MPSNDIYVLKGRFKALTTNTFGIFIIIINKSSKSIEKMHIVASHFSSMYENDPEQSWNKYEEIIAQYRYTGEISTSLSNDFQALFNSTFQAEIIESFIDAMDSKNIAKAEHVLESLIEKILSDKNISLQLEKQLLSKDELDKIKTEAENHSKEKAGEATPAKSEPNKAPMFEIEEGGVLLNIELIIGPISGIPVNDLREGDQIVVKIAGRTQKEQYFIDLLNSRNDKGDILPVRAVVKQIISNKQAKEYNILVEIGPGIYGRAVEQEQVKLKRYDPLLDAKNLKKNSSQNTITPSTNIPSKSSSMVFLWLIGAVTLILAVLFLVFLKIL